MSAEERLRSYLKRVTAELLETRERLAAAAAEEDIAIVGMACRFPGGADSPEQLWQLLLAGENVSSPLPGDRGWDLAGLPDELVNGSDERRFGGFLRDATDFDADFFGISPREAAAMDPQHRLLLESAWLALEDAGIPPDQLHGTQTGTYVGVISGDHASHLTGARHDGRVEGFFVSGAGAAFASGRIAYALGLNGPALTIDTACSSALVALHEACGAIRQGDCEIALVGGAAVTSTLTTLLEFHRQGGLAPDGRCKPFGARADGTAFSEGVGMLVLQPLSAARRAGREVLAVVRGSAVNQDGASNGLTAPNGAAQEQVIRKALSRAGLTPDDIDAVEAHGTGTTLGDPIEAQALLTTYGGRRNPDRPLLVGSVKSNIGHTQAAAGIAGVIKTVLAIRHGVLPASLGIDGPTPHVDWSSGQVRLLTEATPWPDTGAPRRAGVSSFSLSGTNAHTVIEQAPVEPEANEATSPPSSSPITVPWLLSARSEAALRTQAQRLLGYLEDEPGASSVDIGFTLATGRATLRHRAVVVGSDRTALTAGLDALADGGIARGLVRDVARERTNDVVFVFPGQGSQWTAMGAELLASSQVFAQEAEKCLAEFDRHLDWSLSDVLLGRSGARTLDEDEVIQPALFTMMVSLAAMWRSSGVEPTSVVGHSQGELAAAYVAGALDLSDAVRTVVLRSRVLAATLRGRGGMVALALPLRQSEDLIRQWGGRLGIAAVNGPRSTAVSGDTEALRELLAVCARSGTSAHRIPIDYASHSHQVDEIKQQLLDALGTISPGATSVPFFSTVTGEQVPGGELTASYWFENLRRPVQFAETVNGLLHQGFTTFVECSPHPVLAYGLEDLVRDHGGDVVLGTTLRRGDGGPNRFLTSVGELHTKGVPVDWSAAFEGAAARRVSLPSYPFQRRRFWYDARSGVQAGSGTPNAAQRPGFAPSAVEVADDASVVLSGLVAQRDHPWLADHALGGTALVPATAFVALARQAAERVRADRVEELTLHAPWVLAPGEEYDLQVSVGAPDGSGGRSLSLHTRVHGEVPGPWRMHADGSLCAERPAADSGAAPEDLGPLWPPPGSTRLELDDVYARLARKGFHYGPGFRGLRNVWRQGGDLFAEVSLETEQGPGEDGFDLHPALLDAALHPLLADREVSDPNDETIMVPFAWRGVTVRSSATRSLRVRLTPLAENQIALVATDGSGAPALSVDSLVLRPTTVAQLRGSLVRHDDLLFRLEWPVVDTTPPLRPPRCVHLGAPGAWAQGLGYPLSPTGQEVSAAADSGGEAPELFFATLPMPEQDGLPTSGDTGLTELLDQALGLLRHWLADDGLAAVRLVMVTTGAVALDGEVPPHLLGAALWGLVRAAQSEHPGRIVLVDTDGSARSGAVLAAAATGDEPQLVIRDGVVRAARLGRTVVPPASGPNPPPKGGTALITGGLGTLGGAVARHAVQQWGYDHLLLAGRRGEDTPGAAALTAELSELGAVVTVARCDVSDRVALRDLLAGLPADQPLKAVVHAAGVIDDGTVAGLSTDQLRRVIEAKAEAAWALHHATRDLDLDEFVLFSSLSGVLGRAGQANYAAANAFLDALAHYRHARGLPAKSVAWGLWDQVSAITGAGDQNQAGRVNVSGLRALSTTEGLALLDAARSAAVPTLVAARFDLTPSGTAGSSVIGLPVMSALVGRAHRAPGGNEPEGPRSETGSLRRELSGSPLGERRKKLFAEVSAAVVMVLGPVEGLEEDRTFRELGFDSLTAVELRNHLGARSDLRLPASLVFDYPTPGALTDHLLTQLAEGDLDDLPDTVGEVKEVVENLRAMVSARTAGDAVRDEAVRQVRRLLAEWTEVPGEAVAELESAGADDLFQLLDQQLGASRPSD
ncbi:SDR family NAD(P)-dependent oxidoreductase [Streptomyces sp. NPDC005955]|uniref:type I polyketide synthase n=1 Tax=Streptomyces sp. NPDC005955 TaxID=3364738 RepID=UPI00367F2520